MKAEMKLEVCEKSVSRFNFRFLFFVISSFPLTRRLMLQPTGLIRAIMSVARSTKPCRF
jgi:hypothetical protein